MKEMEAGTKRRRGGGDGATEGIPYPLYYEGNVLIYRPMMIDDHSHLLWLIVTSSFDSQLIPNNDPYCSNGASVILNE
jgi:hypothetical protein